MATNEKRVLKLLHKADEALNEQSPDIDLCRVAFADLKSNVTEFLQNPTPLLRLSGQDWSRALRKQAGDDLDAVELLSEKGGPPTVICMLLQMVFEKLAKAAVALVDVNQFLEVRMSHVAASRMVTIIKTHDRHKIFRYKWKDILPLVKQRENAHPAVTKSGPHLEYPWEGQAQMGLPKDLAVVREFDQPKGKGPTLVRFARELYRRFDEMFT